jgi:hypothetical protein
MFHILQKKSKLIVFIMQITNSQQITWIFILNLQNKSISIILKGEFDFLNHLNITSAST